MSLPLPLDHVGVVVASLDQAIPVFERLTRAVASRPERVDAQGVEVVFLGEGPGKLELLAPLSDASPVARFLARRGPGLHHLAYRVAGIEAAMAELRAAGFEPIDGKPRQGAHGRVAFFHPRSTGGVLIELVEG